MQTATDKKKFLGMLGLAAKARRLTVGTSLVCTAISKKIPVIVLISSEASENTRKKIKNKCSFYEIRCIETDISGDDISYAIGKTNSVSAVAVNDANFASAIEKLITAKLQ